MRCNDGGGTSGEAPDKTFLLPICADRSTPISHSIGGAKPCSQDLWPACPAPLVRCGGHLGRFSLIPKSPPVLHHKSTRTRATFPKMVSLSVNGTAVYLGLKGCRTICLPSILICLSNTCAGSAVSLEHIGLHSSPSPVARR